MAYSQFGVVPIFLSVYLITIISTIHASQRDAIPLIQGTDLMKCSGHSIPYAASMADSHP